MHSYDPNETLRPLLPAHPIATGFFAAVLWLAVLGVVVALPALMLSLHVPSAHLPRYALAGVLAGVGVGRLFFHPARSWGPPLRNLVLGAGLAVVAWAFLPPVDEVNLWSAWFEADRLADQVERLRIGDRDGFERERERRAALTKGFPELRRRLEAAEDAWTNKTNHAIALLTNRVKVARSESTCAVAEGSLRRDGDRVRARLERPA